MAGQSIAINPKDFRTFLEGRRGALERISGKLINPDKVVQTVLLCFTKNPALLRCSQASIFRAILQAAEVGLVPGNPNEAHLVPFGTECTLVPDYRGLVKLALDSDYVVSVEPRAAFEGDEFRIEYGLNPNLVHVPGRCTDPKKMTDVYVVWQTKFGTRAFDRMTRDEVDAIRARSKAGQNGPWVSDYVAMAKKTVIKRASKMWPKSKAFEKAIALENAHDTGDYSLTEFELPESQPEAVQKAAGEDRVQAARKNMRREDATVKPTEPELTPLQLWARAYEASGLATRGTTQATVLKAMLGATYTGDEPPTAEQCQIALDSLPAYLDQVGKGADETPEEHGAPDNIFDGE